MTRQHLRRVFDDIGLIQIDSVNVLVRSQELPLFARLGAHPRTLIPDAVAAGELFEYWAHVASHRADQAPPAVSLADGGDGRRSLRPALHAAPPRDVEKVLDQVRDRGPLAVGDVEGRVRNPGTWWNWDDAKLALEILFDQGVVTVTRRPNDFARLYDLIERVVPAEVLAAAPIRKPTLGDSCCCSPPARSASPRSRISATTTDSTRRRSSRSSKSWWPTAR